MQRKKYTKYFVLCFISFRGAAGSGSGAGGGGSNFPAVGYVASLAGVAKPPPKTSSVDYNYYYNDHGGHLSVYYQFFMIVPQGYTISATFSYTGGIQTYKVPASITSLFIIACGAKGGDVYNTNSDNVDQFYWGYYYNNYGGNGGCVSIVKTVTPTTLFYVMVGGAGLDSVPRGDVNSGSSFYFSGGGGVGTEVLLVVVVV